MVFCVQDLLVCETLEADKSLTHVWVTELELHFDELRAWGVFVNFVECHFRDVADHREVEARWLVCARVNMRLEHSELASFAALSPFCQQLKRCWEQVCDFARLAIYIREALLERCDFKDIEVLLECIVKTWEFILLSIVFRV